MRRTSPLKPYFFFEAFPISLRLLIIRPGPTLSMMPHCSRSWRSSSNKPCRRYATLKIRPYFSKVLTPKSTPWWKTQLPPLWRRPWRLLSRSNAIAVVQLPHHRSGKVQRDTLRTGNQLCQAGWLSRSGTYSLQRPDAAHTNGYRPPNTTAKK